MFAQLFTVAVLAISAAHSVSADCVRSYTIQEGDFCDKISQAQNVSTYQLAAVNSNSVDSSCSNLIPGASLCLAENAAEDCQTTYVVLPEDTCFDVSQKNALNLTILYLNNPQINEACSNIYDGEVLCTSKTVQVPPIPAGGVTVAAPGATSTVLTPTASVAAATTPVTVAPTASATAADDGSCDDDTTTTDDSDDDSCDDDTTGSTNTGSTTKGSGTSDSNDDDDDDLPFCDEL